MQKKCNIHVRRKNPNTHTHAQTSLGNNLMSAPEIKQIFDFRFSRHTDLCEKDLIVRKMCVGYVVCVVEKKRKGEGNSIKSSHVRSLTNKNN